MKIFFLCFFVFGNFGNLPFDGLGRDPSKVFAAPEISRPGGGGPGLMLLRFAGLGGVSKYSWGLVPFFPSSFSVFVLLLVHGSFP